MLSDDEHGVDGELVAAAAQRFRDRRVDGKIELFGSRRALVALRLLVDVERHDLHVRLVPRPVLRIAHQKPVPDVLRVRQVAIDRCDDCDPFHLYVLQKVEAFVG